MSVEMVFGFLVGVTVCALAVPAVRAVQRRYERRRNTAATEENQVSTISQALHLAFQGSPTGATVVDRAGDVILSNPSAHEMALVHDRTINAEVWKVAQEVFEDKETRSLDLKISQRRTGHRVTQVQAVVKPLTLNDDRFVIIYGSDESESVRMEAARRDFVANVSHELKTPVGGIALLAEALLEDPGDPAHVEYFGTRVQKEAARMANMVNELIALSKLQGAERLPEMEPVRVDDIVTDAIARNQLTADALNIELTAGQPTDKLVMADKSLLVTALSNLIVNAINYSPESTPVSVTKKVVGEHGKEIVLIRVTDRGVGIAPEDQKRVFERFFRVDKARSRQTGGTGLGLSIVKHVVANHGGNLKLWSRPGTGSTFTIELPVYNEIPLLNDQNPAGTPVTLDNRLGAAVVARANSRRKDKA
ncbi:histidine kinase [Corynebacterium phocae]|uniref:Sensor-like histidine kinase SenX3 n=1 Tax=Corynebacterium phocae TaxID=161895 RepID=A0A1L7D154_9CORY|nr:ATP-binding protein [Corynebacterium phocae]APT91817.1 histidine kinase [Corynebacterium phocae]KAA8727932.1 sensor histidine kinase [Corynebacterium phocae]